MRELFVCLNACVKGIFNLPPIQTWQAAVNILLTLWYFLWPHILLTWPVNQQFFPPMQDTDTTSKQLRDVQLTCDFLFLFSSLFANPWIEKQFFDQKFGGMTSLSQILGYVWVGNMKEWCLAGARPLIPNCSSEAAQWPVDQTVVVVGSFQLCHCVCVREGMAFLKKRAMLSAKPLRMTKAWNVCTCYWWLSILAPLSSLPICIFSVKDEGQNQ